MNPDLPQAKSDEDLSQLELEGGCPPSLLERLLDLAHDVSSYLRHHANATVRSSAALLLAASLAACGPSAPSPNTISPLTQEVSSGLPSAPGIYPIQAESLARDAQGVYHFAWQQAGAASPWNSAQASLMRLSKGSSNQLEIPSQGDPILHVSEDTPIALVPTANDLRTPTPQASSSSSGTSRSSSGGGLAWYPFFGGTSTGPAYYNPAPQTAPGAATVQGSQTSTTRPSAASRVSGLAHAVSGQSGGTGSGNAVTNRSGAGASAVGGQSGGVGSGSAATGKSGATGSDAGVGAARSSGFSSGGGGSFFGGSSG